ncbi:hypothetical protein Y032_0047g1471 [Ancylostoma ceylanicum]|uniref:RRM domain-containing protein n=1 Tax=Ancylostoma ceylanicum TaxID=53326 RepID=A0A016UAT3_9BILA|nr:hypothetical protein Y032_0047g1471 [Ancylostoma ceylanicum]
MDERSTDKGAPVASSSSATIPEGNPATSREKDKNETAAKKAKDSQASSISSGGKEETYHDCRIYVSNIPFSYRDVDLIQMFSPFGKVSNAEVVMNERGSKGFGFVTLDTKEASEAARAALHGTIIQGRVIEVKKATAMRRPSSQNRSSQAQAFLPGLFLPPTITRSLPLSPNIAMLKQGLLSSAQAAASYLNSDQLTALLATQNQVGLQGIQSLLTPLATRDGSLSSLLLPGQLPLQQPALVAGTLPAYPLGLSPVPLQLVYATPYQSALNSSIPHLPSAPPAAVIPVSTPGIASFSHGNSSSVITQPPVAYKVAQNPSTQVISSNGTFPTSLLNSQNQPPPPAGYLDVLGSLGIGAGIIPPGRTVSLRVQDNSQIPALRSLDQSCVIDTSFHGEPLKEGQFGAIGRAVPSTSISNATQVSSGSSDFPQLSSVPLDDRGYGCITDPTDGTPYIPPYRQFEASNDRNGRKRQNTIDDYYLNKKQAKSM